MERVRTLIHFSKVTLDWLRKEAIRRETSMSSLVREYVREKMPPGSEEG